MVGKTKEHWNKHFYKCFVCFLFKIHILLLLFHSMIVIAIINTKGLVINIPMILIITHFHWESKQRQCKKKNSLLFFVDNG